MLLLDTAEEHGFLPEPKKFASGDDVEVIGRGVKLLKLASGAQAQARHESWKKRQVQLPHELKASRRRGEGRIEKGRGCAGRGKVIRAAIFDLDGTLVDSNDLHVQAWQETFRHFGKEIPVENSATRSGKAAINICRFFSAKRRCARSGSRWTSFAARSLRKNIFRGFALSQRVHELFERVRGDGKKIALASSGKADEVEHYQKLLGIEGLVDCQTTADDVAHSKPKADVFIAALRLLGPFGAGPGDRDRGHALRYRGGEEDRSGDDRASLRRFPGGRLRDAGAVAIFRDPADLLDHYYQSPLAG